MVHSLHSHPHPTRNIQLYLYYHEQSAVIMLTSPLIICRSMVEAPRACQCRAQFLQSPSCIPNLGTSRSGTTGSTYANTVVPSGYAINLYKWASAQFCPHNPTILIWRHTDMLPTKAYTSVPSTMNYRWHCLLLNIFARTTMVVHDGKIPNLGRKVCSSPRPCSPIRINKGRHTKRSRRYTDRTLLIPSFDEK